MADTLPISPFLAKDPETGFYFRRPEKVTGESPALFMARGLGALASRGVLELRTRTDHPDGRRENIAEHGFMLGKVAPYVIKALYPDADMGRVSLLANLHDDLECWVLDTATDFITPEELVAKEQREAAAFAQAKIEYADVPYFVALIEEYEDQETFEAQATRVADKLMTSFIHIPNKGAVLKRYYTRESYIEARAKQSAKQRARYPQLELMHQLYDELYLHLADRFLPAS